jgi:zinc protease
VKRLAIALLLTSAASLHAEQKTPPPPAPARNITLPKITERKLENGLTVVLVPLHNVPKVTTLLTFLSGTGADAREHPGIAQLAARVVPEGTATRTSRQLHEAIRAVGGALTVNADADATTIEASSLAEFTPRLLELVADVARHPAFPKDELALAKQNLAQEIAEQRSTPEFLAEENMRKALFGTHPYSFVTAEPDALAKLTRESLVAFAAARYVPNDAHLIVVGDIDVDKALADVTKTFGDWKRMPRAADTAGALPKRDKRTIVFVDRPGSVQSLVRIAALAPSRKSGEYYALRIANLIAGGAFYSRMTRNIREAKGYSYSPYTEQNLQRRAGTFFAEAAARNEVTGGTILEMLYELDRMRIENVTDEELQSARRYSAGIAAVELETQSALARRIWTIYTYDLPRDFLTTFRTKNDAISAADVRRAASKYFDTYRAAIVVVGDWSKVKDQVEPFGDVTVIHEEAAK